MSAAGAATDPGTAPPECDHGDAHHLGALAASVGAPLNDEQLAQFAAYRDLLIEWNTRFNLTAVTAPHEIDRRLFVDALRMLPALDACGRGADGAGGRLVDVGSGAGFPGLPLKIARPGWDVALVEATGKKVAFLIHAIAALGLDGARAIHGRAEDLGHDPAHRGRYDVAVARAVAALPALLELCLPLLRRGGVALFPKGASIADELAAGERAASLLGGRVLGAATLPGGETRLVRVAKVGPTPTRFPRRAGLPAREPLGAARAADNVATLDQAPAGRSA